MSLALAIDLFTLKIHALVSADPVSSGVNKGAINCLGRGRREESMRKTLVRGHYRRAAPFQVAAVCFRRKGNSVEFLLVRTSSGRWTSPKGHREPGLSHAEVAALGAFEEGGVEGRVDSRPIGSYVHLKESLKEFRSRELTVHAFLLEV